MMITHGIGVEYDVPVPAEKFEEARNAIGLKDNIVKIRKYISSIYGQIENGMAENESIFLPDFPIVYMAILHTALVPYPVVPIYVQSDSVWGGAGVRIYPKSAIIPKDECCKENL